MSDIMKDTYDNMTWEQKARYHETLNALKNNLPNELAKIKDNEEIRLLKRRVNSMEWLWAIAIVVIIARIILMHN